MSRFLLAFALLTLSGCLLPAPGDTVAAPGPWEFSLSGGRVTGDTLFQIENRLGEKAPRCPGCLRWCPEDGLQARGWEEFLPPNCAELAFLVDFVERVDGAAVSNAGLAIPLGFRAADNGDIEALSFDFSTVPAKDIEAGNDGWILGWTGDLGGSSDAFFVNSFQSTDGGMGVCWSTAFASIGNDGSDGLECDVAPTAPVGGGDDDDTGDDDDATGDDDDATPDCADKYEPNDTVTQPTFLSGESGVIPNLRLCDDDQDWFAVPLTAGQTVTADVRFAHAEGDIDAYIKDSAGSLLADSTSSTNDEQVSYTTQYDVEVYLQVLAASTGANVAYEIEVLFQ